MKLNQSVKTLVLILTLFIPVAAFAHGMSQSDIQAMIAGGNLRYVWLGATHMFTGYDHLLFIFGVIFFLTGFRDIVKYITAFTLGHSITLIFATVFSISANYFLIDAVIALSVCYKGFENIDGFKKFLDRSSPNLLLVIFSFGLVHGFGLSTRLQQLPLGESGLIMRILSFNVGVEIGQVIALAIMLLILSGWRMSKSFTQFSAISNGGLIAAGAFLFIMQMHGYSHNSSPDDFSFSSDNHYHEHQKMEQELIQKQRNSHKPFAFE
nr:HupE/UreJ family protein [Desulfobulbaceae bacterium]